MNNEHSKTGTTGTKGTGTFGSHTHAHEGFPLLGTNEDYDLEFVPDGETVMEGSEPVHALPNFPQQGVEWPTLIQQVVNLGRTPAQRDILLLGMLDVIGATLGPKVRTLYNGKWLSPCMMLFVVAPPASGKGVLAWLRQIIQPFHNELHWEYEAKMKSYKVEKMKFDALGKERSANPNIVIPEAPVRKLFLIPGNNSGTGMAVNLINSGGRGIIFETEADTLSAALNADYGQFDDFLRNTFDHERISLYRRTNDESHELETSYLSLLLCGTPGQIKPLIDTVENGLASRFIWYYMPAVQQWQNQFERTEDMTEWFRKLGTQWKRTVDNLKTVSSFTFELTDVQQELFNVYMSSIFTRGLNGIGNEAVSSIIRIAHHLLRIMSVVALLRVLQSADGNDAKQLNSVYTLLKPAPDIPLENIADGICPRYVYNINDVDFRYCLLMGDTLFKHAMHILSLLPAVNITNRGSATQELLFSAMGDQFARKDYLDKAGELNINPNTALQWLKRGLKKGQLLKVDRGIYAFTHACV